MKQHDPSSHSFSGTDWQMLGELTVHGGTQVEREIREWLSETLEPLELHGDLLDRILRSAREAAVRALGARDPAREDVHIHVLAFAPRTRQRSGQTWGFFRLEKFEDRSANKSPPDHAIEFYLYPENR